MANSISNALKAAANAIKSKSSSSNISSSVTTSSSGVKVIQQSNGTTRYYTAADHSKEHVNTSTGTSIDQNVLQQAINNGAAYKNTVTGINTYDGSTVTYEGYVYNGVTYTANGERIVNGGRGNQGGLIPGKDEIERNIKNETTTVWYYQSPPPSSSSSSTDNHYYPEPSHLYYYPGPSSPVYESFTVPKPTFNSDLQSAHKFVYFFGLDKLEVKSVVQEKNSIRILKDIDVTSAEWIELDVDDYIPEKASIEYYIIDGEKEVPILPNNRKEMKNEKLFPNISTLFEVKEDIYVIRKDGEVVSSKLNEVKNNRDATYSITYSVENQNRYKPTNDEVKIKVILRTYDDTSDAPFIKNIDVKIFGGEGTLWQENT
ncbi:hypothetical protein MKY88_24365 [Lysinibacillus sp. FSL R7-0073]|uniref:hypothetical protein n=1 Tax=Lysinibacillus TaxID=400634 RepID=UPI0018816948|nr:hypothetical protein [Lysinibacillus fusiformis]MBD8523924.1 hypothetical protein [Lysinibacillus fusiformis]MCR8854873.1 hypothetical protein [Lysinibacillus fusiformis]MED4889012.1 hypothetical protein [Lysinibacillus fusiformis]WKT77144.1 hypothetical protein QYY55_24705 [Lysinibacillus fusiformis]